MTVEALAANDSEVLEVVTPAAGYSAGEVIQMPDGRAGVVEGLVALISGDPAGIRVRGRVTVAKTSGVVVLRGAPLYWDRSANTATPLQALTGGDFFLGVADDDAASTDATVGVDLNVPPVYTIDALRDASTTAYAATHESLSMAPGKAELKFTTATEAQKVDILSDRSWPITVPFIVEGRFNVIDNGDHAAFDFNIGVASATHASDCDSIAESCFLHIDGNALDIYTESDDGTTEVAADDTDVNFAEGTAVDFAIDARDLTDIQIYINGVLVNGSTVHKLDAATGPLKLLAHLEKSSDDSPGQVNIEKLAVRLMDVAN